MPRIRTIKPEWLDDEALGQCSDAARVLSVGLICMADDHGNGRAHPLLMGSRIWCYEDDPAESLRKLAESLGELAEIGYVTLYSVKKQQYFHITNWAKHQRIDNAGKPHVPGPSQADNTRSAAAPGAPEDLAASSRKEPESSRLDHDPDQDHEHDLGEGSSDDSPTKSSWLTVVRLFTETGGLMPGIVNSDNKFTQQAAEHVWNACQHDPDTVRTACEACWEAGEKGDWKPTIEHLSKHLATYLGVGGAGEDDTRPELVEWEPPP